MQRVALIGSRTWRDRGAIERIVEDLAEDTIIVTGGAPGADRIAAELASARGLEVRIYEPNWRAGRHAGLKRNEWMLTGADRVFAFWDGRSSGTAHAIQFAREQRIPVEIIRAEPEPELPFEWPITWI